MDVQLKRGILDVCVLAATRKREPYGYEVIKRVGRYAPISESTLYPVLRRFESVGALTVRGESYNGKLRKYDGIAPRGTAKIETFLSEWKEMINLYRFISGKREHG